MVRCRERLRGCPCETVGIVIGNGHGCQRDIRAGRSEGPSHELTAGMCIRRQRSGKRHRAHVHGPTPSRGKGTPHGASRFEGVGAGDPAITWRRGPAQVRGAGPAGDPRGMLRQGYMLS